MKTMELKVKLREGSGKQAAKKVRLQGLIPAIIYGAGKESFSIQMDSKEFESVIRTGAGENVVLTLKIEGGKTNEETVLIKDIQHDPISDKVLHVDFNIISLTEKIEAEVPVYEKGEAVGVRDGGVLENIHRTVTVECLPTEIPDRITVIINDLKINDVIYAKELPFPEGVKCLLDPDEVILKISPPAKEEVPEEVAAEEGAAGPEVITEKKKEEKEEAAGKEEAPGKAKEEKKS
jgi:large subunit ribosomal protein L25